MKERHVLIHVCNTTNTLPKCIGKPKVQAGLSKMSESPKMTLIERWNVQLNTEWNTAHHAL